MKGQMAALWGSEGHTQFLLHILFALSFTTLREPTFLVSLYTNSQGWVRTRTSGCQPHNEWSLITSVMCPAIRQLQDTCSPLPSSWLVAEQTQWEDRIASRELGFQKWPHPSPTMTHSLLSSSEG